MKKRITAILPVIMALVIVTVFVSPELYRIYRTASADNPGAVLMYHCISDPPPDAITGLYVTPVQFENQLKWLKSRYYISGFARDCGEKNTVVLTFDDGYADFYHNAYPLLKKHRMKGTVFVITDYIGREGYLDENMIREMADSGYVEVQSHGASHSRFDTLSGDILKGELRSSKQMLEEITGKEVYAVCYPNGTYDSEVLWYAMGLYTHGFTTVFPQGYDGSITNMLAVPRYGIGYGLGEEEFFGAFIKQER